MTREEKIRAAHQRRRDLRNNIFDEFANLIKGDLDTFRTWFSSRVDSQGYKRVHFSDKSIEHLNNEFVSNGIKPTKGITLFRCFVRRMKSLSGDPNYSIRRFLKDAGEDPNGFQTSLEEIKQIKDL